MRPALGFGGPRPRRSAIAEPAGLLIKKRSGWNVP